MNAYIKLLTTIFYIHYGHSVQEVNHIGCYKTLQKPLGCKFDTEDQATTFSTKLINTTANAYEWIREQNIVNDVPSLSWILAALRIAGSVNEGGKCTNHFGKYKTKLDFMTVDDVTSLSGGKLALFLLGLKASCKDARNFKNQDLIQMMKIHMNAFPKGEFNDYYHFSLGMIALYVHGVKILSTHGQTLLNGMHLHNNVNKKQEVTSIDAMAIIALSALDQQKFVAHPVRKHLRGAKRSIRRKIENIFKSGIYQDAVTVAHLLQVLHATGDRLYSSTYCPAVYNWLQKQQNDDGSFDGLMSTSTILPVLNGYSILDLRTRECPMTQDNVNNKKLKHWIRRREHRAKKQNQTKRLRRRNRHKENGHQGNRHNIKKTMLVKLQIVFDNEVRVQIEEMIIKANKGMTIADVLRKAEKHHKCFQHEMRVDLSGVYLAKLCNTPNNRFKKALWRIYVNGEVVNSSVAKYRVKNHDVVTFKYTTKTQKAIMLNLRSENRQTSMT